MKFDYGAPAELFPIETRGFKRRSVAYKRFESAADAIKYAIEELSAASLAGTILEVGDDRFGVGELKLLYASNSFPLERLGLRVYQAGVLAMGQNDNQSVGSAVLI